jgi:2-iminobutanoate/2-iminopropanoate deaminase
MSIHKERIETLGAPTALGAYSPGVWVAASESLYVSGQIGITPEGKLIEGLAAQTNQVLSNVAAILAVKNCSFEDVVKTELFIADPDYFSTVDDIYEAAFSDVSVKPARTCVVAQIPKFGALVEMSVTAARPLFQA